MNVCVPGIPSGQVMLPWCGVLSGALIETFTTDWSSTGRTVPRPTRRVPANAKNAGQPLPTVVSFTFLPYYALGSGSVVAAVAAFHAPSASQDP
jgi:hypothetical protein